MNKIELSTTVVDLMWADWSYRMIDFNMDTYEETIEAITAYHQSKGWDLQWSQRDYQLDISFYIPAHQLDFFILSL